MNKSWKILSLLFIVLLISCNEEGINREVNRTITLELLPSEATGIEFINSLNVNEMEKYHWDYINVFNGGGTATADFNNDGLIDIYFCGNKVRNELFLNNGDLVFENITDKAGVGNEQSWSTGATVVDINNDGFWDIYVSCAYYDDQKSTYPRKANKLFVNNGDLTFTERAREYGIADQGYSIQSTFFDYDLDGDLDLYVGNHPRHLKPHLKKYRNYKNPQHQSSDHLYENNGDGTFKDVTINAGVLNFGWSLGIVSSDLNNDGYPDLYVTFDHGDPDQLYINQKDKTFKNESYSKLDHIPLSSMGVDAGDINNDGLMDIYSLDMLAKDNYREKSQMASMNPEGFLKNVANGLHYQYMRNAVQLNQGYGQFVDIAQQSNIHNTDWSWAVLLADFNNDSYNDVFVSNGHPYDLMDKDWRNLVKKLKKEGKFENRAVQDSLYRMLKSTPLSNYLFQNNGDLAFQDVSSSSGIGTPGFSSGAAYADLDNDGDLDLVVNNSNMEAWVYKNNSKETNGGNSIQFQFEVKESRAFNTKVKIFYDGHTQIKEMQLTRGYQSSVDPRVHFGVQGYPKIDSVQIVWPDRNVQTMHNLKANEIHKVVYNNTGRLMNYSSEPEEKIFEDVTTSLALKIPSPENKFWDYDYQVLLPHQMSKFGPAMTIGDANGDELDDLFIGGAVGAKAKILIQNQAGQFNVRNSSALELDTMYEDVAASFIDHDGDGDLDLYVSSGGNEWQPLSAGYQDRLYENDGSGNFTKTDVLPNMNYPGGRVKPFDFDKDGDMDILVTGRHAPWNYPRAGETYLLVNENGNYTNKIEALAPEMQYAGMVTDATWNDFNNDGIVDVLLVGEWMHPKLFVQKDGKFVDESLQYGLTDLTGWGFSCNAGDFDGDGDMDVVYGNLGLNYKYKASKDEPFVVYHGDLDGNNKYDIVLQYYNDGNAYPVRGKQCSSQQLPIISEMIPTYNEFGGSTIDKVYGDQLNEAEKIEAKEFRSGILWNENGSFEFQALPNYAQIAPINGIIPIDVDNDGDLDMITAGNLYVSEVETGRADAGRGSFIENLGNREFKANMPQDCGLYLPGDVKDIQLLKLANGSKAVVAAKNNDYLQVVKMN